MKLFLTGATGFIGAIARAAIFAGHQVTTLVRSTASGPAVSLENARQTMGPFADAIALDQGMSGRLARQFLAWTPKRPGVVSDLSNQMQR